MPHVSTDITFKGLDRSEAVEEKIHGWVERLERVCDDLRKCAVTIELPHRHHLHGRRFQVRIDLDVPNGPILVSHDHDDDGAHEDVNVAVRDAFQAARRRLQAHVETHAA